MIFPKFKEFNLHFIVIPFIFVKRWKQHKVFGTLVTFCEKVKPITYNQDKASH